MTIRRKPRDVRYFQAAKCIFKVNDRIACYPQPLTYMTTDRADRADRTDRTDRTDRVDRTDRTDMTGQI